MQWRVYYLYSTRLNQYYIGKSNDIERRLYDHNRGKEAYTKKGVPWKLIAYIDCLGSKEAARLENKLKKSKNKKYTRWYFDQHGIILE